MEILEIEKILNRVSLHCEEFGITLPYNFPSVNEVKRAFENQDTNYSQVILAKFKSIKKIYELIEN